MQLLVEKTSAFPLTVLNLRIPEVRLAIIALATPFAIPAFAGSPEAPHAEPSVVMAPTAPVITGAAPLRSFYGALSVVHATPDTSFTQDDDAPRQMVT